MPVICRQAGDEFEAVMVADGMDKAGAKIISVTFRDNAQRPAHATFFVFAKVDGGDDAIDVVDKAINFEFKQSGRRGYI